MFWALLTLIRKELQSLLSSRQSRAMLIVPVILQVALFPFAATLEVKNSTLAVYDEDGGAASIELQQRLAHAKAFPHIISVHSDAQLREAIDSQQALLAVRLPAGFSRRMARGEPVLAQAIIDGRRSNAAQIAFGYAQAIVQAYALERSPAPGGVRLDVRHLYNQNLDYRWFVLPNLVAIISTVGCLMVTALSLSREQEEGTFDQLLVSPLGTASIMAGKALPGILVAVLQGSIVAAAASWVYGVPLTGSLAVFYLAMACYGFALSGIGLFISALCASQQQAFLGVFGFIAPAVILSGYIAPVENMPAPLRLLSAADPLSHFIVIVKGIFLEGHGLVRSWPHLWPLVAISFVTLTMAYLLFEHRKLQ